MSSLVEKEDHDEGNAGDEADNGPAPVSGII